MKGARTPLSTLLFSGQPLLLVFAVTPQKQQQQNVLWIKSRIRKIKGGLAQILTKIQIVAFFDMRDIRRNHLVKCTGLCMEMLVSIRMGTNMASGNQQKRLLLSFGTKARFQVLVFLIQ